MTWANGDTTFIRWNDNPHHHPADKSKPTRADFATIDPDALDFIDDLTGYIWNTYHILRLAEKSILGPTPLFG